jgi:hypothetical protein
MNDALRPGANPNDQGRGPVIIGILWAFTIIATLVVIMRIYVRKNIDALSWDDWLMSFAMVRSLETALPRISMRKRYYGLSIIKQIFQLLGTAFVTRAYSLGLGMHDKDLTFNQIVNILKWGWLNMIPGTFVAVLARVSGAIFLTRLFGVRHWFKWYMILYTPLQCIGGITVLLVTFAGNRPVEAIWNPTVKGSRVKAEVSLYTAITAQGKSENKRVAEPVVD